MKVSRYNYILSKGCYSYWYNGLEHTFFRLPLSLGEKIRGIIENNPDSLLSLSESFYNKLKNNGFIVDDVDELDTIRRKNEEAINKKDYFLVVLPTLNCNFKCWYCVQEHVASLMSDVTIEKIKNHIRYMIDEEKIESLHLEWFGGEPFMFFKKVIKPIAQYAIEKCKDGNISFHHTATTNGYFLAPAIVDDLVKLKFESFQITLDGPKALHDEVKFQKGCSSAFCQTLENIEYMLNHSSDIFVVLRINYTHNNLDEIIVQQINEIISPKNRSHITISLKKVWQEHADMSICKDVNRVLNIFETSGYKVKKLDIVSTFMSCYTDKKYYN